MLKRSLAALLLALLAAAPVMAAEDMHSMQMESIEQLRGLSGEEFEVAYINRVVPHHEDALKMAEAVVQRAPHSDARAAAAKIVEDQQREIEMLTSYLRDEHGAELERDAAMMMPESMMTELERATAGMAELMFLLMMREHHESAIMMGEIALEKEVSDTLREQAQMMVESQAAEQEQFEAWAESWYHVEAPEPTGDMEAAMKVAMAAHMPDTATETPTPNLAPALLAGLLAGLAWFGLLALRARRTPA